MGKDEIKKHRNVLNIELLDRRLYNPEIALGDFSDIKRIFIGLKVTVA